MWHRRSISWSAQKRVHFRPGGIEDRHTHRSKAHESLPGRSFFHQKLDADRHHGTFWAPCRNSSVERISQNGHLRHGRQRPSVFQPVTVERLESPCDKHLAASVMTAIAIPGACIPQALHPPLQYPSQRLGHRESHPQKKLKSPSMHPGATGAHMGTARPAP